MDGDQEEMEKDPNQSSHIPSFTAYFDNDYDIEEDGEVDDDDSEEEEDDDDSSGEDVGAENYSGMDEGKKEVNSNLEEIERRLQEATAKEKEAARYWRLLQLTIADLREMRMSLQKGENVEGDSTDPQDISSTSASSRSRSRLMSIVPKAKLAVKGREVTVCASVVDLLMQDQTKHDVISVRFRVRQRQGKNATKHKAWRTSGGPGSVTKWEYFWDVNLVAQTLRCAHARKETLVGEWHASAILYIDSAAESEGNSVLRLALEPDSRFSLLFPSAQQRRLFFEYVSLIRAESANLSVWIPRQFLDVVPDTSPLLRLEDHGQKSSEQMTVFVGTWNIGRAPLSSEVTKFFQPLQQCDVYVFGFQECGLPGKDIDVFGEVEKSMARFAYATVSKVQLWEMRMIILCKRKHLSKVSNVFTSSKASGFMKFVGNKGAIMTTFSILGSSFCFLSAHFLSTTGENRKEREQHGEECIDGVADAFRRLSFSPDLPLETLFDYVFVFGDLNYRVTLDYEAGVKFLEMGKLDVLKKRDQFLTWKREGSCMFSFQEGEINFGPTYSYEPGVYPREASKTKQKTPSWCDRVLVRSNGPTQAILQKYDSMDEICSSNHSPVYAMYTLPVERPYLSFLDTTPPCDVTFLNVCIGPTSGEAMPYVCPKELHAPKLLFSSPDILFDSVESSPVESSSHPHWADVDIPGMRCLVASKEFVAHRRITISVWSLNKDEGGAYRIMGYSALRLDELVGTGKCSFSLPLVKYGRLVGMLSGSARMRWLESDNPQEKTDDAAVEESSFEDRGSALIVEIEADERLSDGLRIANRLLELIESERKEGHNLSRWLNISSFVSVISNAMDRWSGDGSQWDGVIKDWMVYRRKEGTLHSLLSASKFDSTSYLLLDIVRYAETCMK